MDPRPHDVPDEDELDHLDNRSRSPADLRRTDAIAWLLMLAACAGWVGLYLACR